MATVNKNFRIKNGLVVEGTTATVNGQNVLTEVGSDQYILDLVGGANLIDSVSSDFYLDGSNQLQINAASDLARTGDIPTSTDELTEGNNNRYFSDFLARSAISSNLGTGITYSDEGTGNVFHIDSTYLDTEITDGARNALSGSGVLFYDNTTGNIQVSYHTGLTNDDGKLVIDRNTVDAWYEASGAVSDHASSSTAHGVTGNIVGTSDTQILSNKTVSDNLTFNNGSANGYVGTDGSNLEIYSTGGDLNLGTQGDAQVTAEQDIRIRSFSGDINITADQGSIVIAADSNAYYGSVASENQLATRGYVDTAVSDLVGAAPSTLDTLQELATALENNPDIIADLENVAAGKQNTLTPGANIDITNDTISVNGLDTDDVTEGQNQYFTDARAIDAISDADIYPNAVIIDNIAKQISSELTGVQASSVVTGHMSSDYKSGKYIVSISNGSHRQVSEILYTIDYANNIDQTEYAIVTTNGTLANISIEYKSSTGAVNLWVHPLNGYTVDLRAMGTWIK